MDRGGCRTVLNLEAFEDAGLRVVARDGWGRAIANPRTERVPDDRQIGEMNALNLLLRQARLWPLEREHRPPQVRARPVDPVPQPVIQARAGRNPNGLVDNETADRSKR